MKRIEKYIKEEMKDCPLSKKQEAALLSALDKYVSAELEQVNKNSILPLVSGSALDEDTPDIPDIDTTTYMDLR